MSADDYGTHAENAARALNRLITHQAWPDDTTQITRVLHCREAAADALRQRLTDLGLTPRPPGHPLPPPAAGLNLAGIDHKLATLLSNAVSGLPTLPPYVRQSPLDMLGPASDDPVTETWRTAAVDLLAATHALGSAEDQPWLRDTAAGWYVLRDLAVALEAVVVLDTRLAEVGLISDLDTPAGPLDLEGMRLVTSQAARVATWYATNPAADHAIPKRPGETSPVAMPVTLVSSPTDLAVAQDRLAGFMRPLTANNSAYVGEPEISADSARQVTTSQLHLCGVFARMAAQSDDTASFIDFFHARAEVLGEIQRHVRHLVDVRPYEPDMRRFWQQGEITTSVSRMQLRTLDLHLRPTEMWSLANATHHVTHNLGMALRRELLRPISNLRDAHPTSDDGPTRVGRRSRLGASLTDLVCLAPPTPPTEHWVGTAQRAALRQTLDTTPTTHQPPAPYPAARQPTPSPPTR